MENFHYLKLLAVVVGLLGYSASVGGEPPASKPASTVVSFATLLDEMVDREAMARWPEPPFTLHQSSSYDRRSKTPGNADWFANWDWSNFIRSENVRTPDGERTEYVMLDERGPGAIVRVWVGGYTDRGIIRFYIDGAAEPVMSGTADEMIGGQKYFPEPFAATRARGRNLYAPIPYAKQIKITYDGPLPKKPGNPGKEGFWYNINYRTYPSETKVESFSSAVRTSAGEQLAKIGRLPKASALRFFMRALDVRLEAGKTDSMMIESERSGAIRGLTLSVSADNPEAALREMVISIEFDGRTTVHCPIGDFFGSGAGINPSKDWWRRVDRGGTMASYWVMPFRMECKIKLTNLGKQTVTYSFGESLDYRPWLPRSLYFHAGFRRDPAIDTSHKSDFNYITVQGRGVYMGDTLTLHNPLPAWWGEGDEKIFVDGETFPSHFGTGSEDYYGYAWGNTEVFNSPFHSQPLAGKHNQGYTVNSRVRMLDRIPFRKSLQLDMEVWHWRPTKVDYRVATFWYGDADNTSNAQTDEK